MYQMLVGSVPFNGDAAEEIARQHREDVPERIDSIIFECPVWLSALVGELLEKDPRKRPYGASAVLLALNETTRQVAAKTTVVEHAAGGFSPLTPQVHKDEARLLLASAGRRIDEPEEQAESVPPFYERAWFLALCLCFLIGGIGTWFLWPESETRLHAKAVAILETKEGVQRENARPLLKRLLKKFPNGEYAAEAEGISKNSTWLALRASSRSTPNTVANRNPRRSGCTKKRLTLNSSAIASRLSRSTVAWPTCLPIRKETTR